MDFHGHFTMREWTFRVEGVTAPGEIMCVVGSCAELGEWNPERVIQMQIMTDNKYTTGCTSTSSTSNLPLQIPCHPENEHFDGFSSTSETSRSSSNLWEVKVMIPDGVDITYRYAVCMFVPRILDEGVPTEKMIVRRWETNLKPRKLNCHDRYDGKYQARFGLIPFRKSSNNSVGSSGLQHPEQQLPSELIQRGWLINETLVQLKLHGHASLQIWKQKHKNKDLYIKVTPIETSKSNFSNGTSSRQNSIDMEESTDISETRARRKLWPIVEVAKLNSEECELRWQKQFGTLYEDNAFIIFQAQVIDVSTAAFLIDVFARPKESFERNYANGVPPCDGADEEGPAEHIGSGYVMPEHFKSTEGRVKKPIISKKFQPIGQFAIDYLVVRPIQDEEKPQPQFTMNKDATVATLSSSAKTLDESLRSQNKNLSKCNFKVTFAKHWKSHWKGLEVAHRGLGNSYTKAQNCSTVRENTIASMKNAVLHGADMIEFDVQVSKDLIPVIYHDFELCLPSTKKNGENHLVEIPLKNLTLEQLQHLRLHHPSEKSDGLKTFPDHDEDHQPFPTLERALSVIDSHAGFNIEIKWDMENMDGTRESHNAFEMNLFVDTILKTVLQNGKSRKIVFSTFNPDICTVLRYKQNKYPVLLLTQGVNTKYDQYLDQRTHNINNGSNFATTSDILGLSAMAEDIQRDPSQVELVKNRGQVLFCWTDDQNSPEIVKYLKSLGINGIIYDRIDVNSAKERKESIFLVEREEDEEDEYEENNMNEVKSDGSSPARSCSCSPHRDALTDANTVQIIQVSENVMNTISPEKDNCDELTIGKHDKFATSKTTENIEEGSDSDQSNRSSSSPPEQIGGQDMTFSGLFNASAMTA